MVHSIPQVPDDHMIKHVQTWYFFVEAGCHFEFLKNVLDIWAYFWGADNFKGVERSTRLQCASPMPQADGKSEYNPFFTIYKGPYFSKHGLPFPILAPPHICTGAMPPCNCWYLDPIPREKCNSVNFITVMTRELSIVWKLEDLSHARQ